MLALAKLHCMLLAVLSGTQNQCSTKTDYDVALQSFTGGLAKNPALNSLFAFKMLGNGAEEIPVVDPPDRNVPPDIPIAGNIGLPGTGFPSTLASRYSGSTDDSAQPSCSLIGDAKVLACGSLSSSPVLSQTCAFDDAQNYSSIEVCYVQDNSTTAYRTHAVRSKTSFDVSPPRVGTPIMPHPASEHGSGDHAIPASAYTKQLVDRVQEAKGHLSWALARARSLLAFRIRELASILGRSHLQRQDRPMQTYQPHDPFTSCGLSSLLESHPVCLKVPVVPGFSYDPYTECPLSSLYSRSPMCLLDEHEEAIRLPLHDVFSSCALTSLFDVAPVCPDEDRPEEFEGTLTYGEHLALVLGVLAVLFGISAFTFIQHRSSGNAIADSASIVTGLVSSSMASNAQLVLPKTCYHAQSAHGDFPFSQIYLQLLLLKLRDVLARHNSGAMAAILTGTNQPKVFSVASIIVLDYECTMIRVGDRTTAGSVISSKAPLAIENIVTRDEPVSFIEIADEPLSIIQDAADEPPSTINDGADEPKDLKTQDKHHFNKSTVSIAGNSGTARNSDSHGRALSVSKDSMDLYFHAGDESFILDELQHAIATPVENPEIDLTTYRIYFGPPSNKVAPAAMSLGNSSLPSLCSDTTSGSSTTSLATIDSEMITLPSTSRLSDVAISSGRQAPTKKWMKTVRNVFKLKKGKSSRACAEDQPSTSESPSQSGLSDWEIEGNSLAGPSEEHLSPAHSQFSTLFKDALSRAGTLRASSRRTRPSARNLFST